MNVTLTNRGLLRAVLLPFALFLAYRFLAGLTTIPHLPAAALLLAVILPAPSSVAPAQAFASDRLRTTRPRCL